MTDRRIVFLDTETTGLNADVAQVYEVAWLALEPGKGLGPVRSEFVSHTLNGADPEALKIGGHNERCPGCKTIDSSDVEERLIAELHGVTLCAANPAFDAGFLSKRWGTTPWHYRMLDIETYAMGALNTAVPMGLAWIVEQLAEQHGVHIDMPDHTAKNDALAVALAYMALRSIYSVKMS